MGEVDGDSPLSIAGSVAGLLTLLFAILASAYIRGQGIREAKKELEAFGATLARHMDERDTLKATFEFEYKLKKVHIDLSGTVEAFRPIFTWRYKNHLHAPKVVFETLQTIFELDVELFYIHREANYAKKPPIDGRYMTEQEWTEYTFSLGYGHNQLKSKMGYVWRWLRLKTKAEDLLRRREGLRSNLLFLMLTHNDRRMSATEARNTKQQEMMEDIWNAMKAKGELVERLQEGEYPKEENEEDQPSSAIFENAERAGGNLESQYTQTFLGLHPQLSPGISPEGARSNPYWAA